jgi:hypothetical protein
MEAQMRPVAASELEQVRSDIEQWRRSRPKWGHMPAHLWEQAAALARTQGTYPVARALRLNYRALGQRVGRIGMRRKPTSKPKRPAFLEVTSAPMFKPPVDESAVVEVVAVDGARLTIRLARGGTDFSALVAAFRERR